jgi:hypothetical protein
MVPRPRAENAVAAAANASKVLRSRERVYRCIGFFYHKLVRSRSQCNLSGQQRFGAAIEPLSVAMA